MQQKNLLGKLKKNFETVLETTENKKYLIEREISALEKFINEDPKPEGALKLNVYKFKSVFDPYELSSIFHREIREIFDHLLLGGSPEDLKITKETYRVPGEYQKKTVDFTVELFQYHKYLVLSLSEKKFLKKKKVILSHKQKLIALHYLGLDLSASENSKLAKVLSAILELSEDNTRQYLSYVSAGKNSVRTKKNLEIVNLLFSYNGLNQISEEIKKDIDKLEKKK